MNALGFTIFMLINQRICDRIVLEIVIGGFCMSKILDGKEVAAGLRDVLRRGVARYKELHHGDVMLAVIQVGDDPASSVYVRNKKRVCEDVGIRYATYVFREETSNEELLSLIDQLNHDDTIHGILVQLPLPSYLDEKKILQAVSPAKDVDGFHVVNAGHLFLNDRKLVPCTASGILHILGYYNIPIDGKRCVVVGRSNIVGNPVAQLLQQRNGTVTVVHSYTKNMREITSQADILVVAAGQKGLITAEDVKEGAVVIDVGIHRDEQNRLSGDVVFEDVKDKVSAITPVPGGVGPMTVAMLMYNCIRAAFAQKRG